MKKWLRILFRIAILLVIGVIILAGVGYWLSHRAPTYYHPVVLPEKEQHALFNNALQKYLQAQESMKKAYADERRAHHAHATGQPAPASEPADEVQVVFTQDELNALVAQWLNQYRDKFEAYFKDPMIVLQDGQIIIAGQLKSPEVVVSVYLNALVDEQGELRLAIDSLKFGRVPAPVSAFGDQRQKVITALEQWLPQWRQEADLSDDGAVNSAAIKAAMSKLVLHALNDEPAAPYLYLPDPSGGSPKTVPVRVMEVRIADKELRLTLEPVDETERQKLIERIKAPYEGATKSD